ncbi:MAG: hypothetical protein ABI704_22370 [Kofleriaceae bacterium]
MSNPIGGQPQTSLRRRKVREPLNLRIDPEGQGQPDYTRFRVSQTERRGERIGTKITKA